MAQHAWVRQTLERIEIVEPHETVPTARCQLPPRVVVVYRGDSVFGGPRGSGATQGRYSWRRHASARCREVPQFDRLRIVVGRSDERATKAKTLVTLSVFVLLY